MVFTTIFISHRTHTDGQRRSLQGGQYHRPNRVGCYTTVTPLLVATSLKHLRCLLHALLVQVYRLFGRQGEIFRQMVF